MWSLGVHPEWTQLSYSSATATQIKLKNSQNVIIDRKNNCKGQGHSFGINMGGRGGRIHRKQIKNQPSLLSGIVLEACVGGVCEWIGFLLIILYSCAVLRLSWAVTIMKDSYYPCTSIPYLNKGRCSSTDGYFNKYCTTELSIPTFFPGSLLIKLKTSGYSIF